MDNFRDDPQLAGYASDVVTNKAAADASSTLASDAANSAAIRLKDLIEGFDWAMFLPEYDTQDETNQAKTELMQKVGPEIKRFWSAKYSGGTQ